MPTLHVALEMTLPLCAIFKIKNGRGGDYIAEPGPFFLIDGPSKIVRSKISQGAMI